MVRRRKSSPFEDSILIASKLPVWLCLMLAALAWLVLHPIALSEVTAPKNMGGLSHLIIAQMMRTAAHFGQYLVPAIFGLGAVISIVTRWRRRTLFEGVAKGSPSESINTLSWQQFEQLVGESFRRQGFTVVENESGGADGGVDLVLRKNGEKWLVQCKQWRAFKVGVSVVRELTV